MKNKKGVFILIIILLCISSLLAIGGIIFKVIGYEPAVRIDADVPINANKEFAYAGYLYFYSDASELIGTYKCINFDDVCDYATQSIDDSQYAINYYEGTNEQIGIINNRYVFLLDNKLDAETSGVVLYDFKGKRNIATYNAVKNYTIGIEANRFIVQSLEGKWGVIELNGDTPKLIINFEHDFLGLANKLSDGILASDSFIAKKGDYWMIISDTGEELSKPITDQIVNYNGKHIIGKLSNYYYLFNYQGNILLESTGYNDLSFVGRYIAILDRNNMFSVYDFENNREIALKKPVPLGVNYTARINDTGLLEVKIGNDVATYPID